MNKNFTVYENTALPKKISVTSLYTVHYFKYGFNFSYEGESHDFWELVYIDSGNAVIVADDKKYLLKQGDAFLHRPNQFHNIYTDNDFANSAIISFGCKNKSLNSLTDKILNFSEYEKTLLNKIISEATLGFSDKLDDIRLKKMTKKVNAPFGNVQIIKNSIELLMLSLIREQKSTPSVIKSLAINTVYDDIVQGVLGIMTEKLDTASTINLDEISFKLGFSKSHIKTQFKKKTGVSILQYFITLKIEKAKKLLSRQKYSVSEISDMLGFASIHYFSRQFKIHTNMSPTKYVNSINANNVL